MQTIFIKFSMKQKKLLKLSKESNRNIKLKISLSKITIKNKKNYNKLDIDDDLYSKITSAFILHKKYITIPFSKDMIGGVVGEILSILPMAIDGVARARHAWAQHVKRENAKKKFVLENANTLKDVSKDQNEFAKEFIDRAIKKKPVDDLVKKAKEKADVWNAKKDEATEQFYNNNPNLVETEYKPILGGFGLKKKKKRGKKNK